MRILVAADQGADGVELVIWLDERRTVTGPDGDSRPDPSYIWRTTIPAETWQADQAAALIRAGELADQQLRRREPIILEHLIGAPLPTPEPAP